MLYVDRNRPTWMHDTLAECIYVVVTANCLRQCLLRAALSIVYSFFPLWLFICHSVRLTLPFPLCGMCSFVQSELDCLLPGGERLMVLLSSLSEMDSSTKAGVWAECIAWQKTYCWNAGSILRKQPQRCWMLILALPLEPDKWELIHINLLNVSNTRPGLWIARQKYWVGGSLDAWAAPWYSPCLLLD